ncbi:MAG TPA: T9SS type A sorting domain-containing protein [Chitinophagaceae bacterium]|nr:T9SS type A sorting domain-containing protein [Chitinophagaceae bacterium]
MWRLILLLLICRVDLQAQKTWDGGAGTNAWADALNWYPDGIPGIEEDVILNNQWIALDYLVELPGGLQTTQVKSIRIGPSTGTISLTLPTGNTAIPGLILSATGNGMLIENGGIFINASGAGSGSPFQLVGKLRIGNGGRYIHRTPRGNAELIDKLNNEPGTEKGIFEFDVPGSTGYTVSLTGNTFGSLSFKALSAGGNKSYSGSGTSNLLIRGDLVIDPGVSVTSTLTSDIVLNGSLLMNGKLNLHPVTAGTTGRSFVFAGRDVSFQGSGTLSMNAFFRNLLVAKNASLTLETPCLLNYTPNTFLCQGTLHCGAFAVSGPGSFLLSDSATFISGADSGIWSTADKGNIRTAFRIFSPQANYQYAGTSSQVTGDGIPDTVASLAVNNSASLLLSKPVVIKDSLSLLNGVLISGSSNRLMLFGARIRSPVSNYSETDAGWEKSFVDGPISIRTWDSSWYNIPAGTGNIFAPLKIKPLDPADNEITVRYIAGPHPVTILLPSLDRISQNGYFDVRSIHAAKWQLAMSYRPADTSSSDEMMTPAILIDVNGQWKWSSTMSKKIPVGQYGWLVTDTAISDLNALTIGYTMNNLLPLELLDFAADNAGAYNLIQWKAEQDGPYTDYLIERSKDGMLYAPIHSSRSTARGIVSFDWKDMLPLEPFNYYRLQMISHGTTRYSPSLRVKFVKRRAILYPNPARDWININFQNGSSRTELEIVNRDGIVLSKHFVKKDSCQIRVSDLTPGTYFARLRNTNGSITLPFTKY